MTPAEIIVLIRLISSGAKEVMAVWEQVKKGEPITAEQSAAATAAVNQAVSNWDASQAEKQQP